MESTPKGIKDGWFSELDAMIPGIKFSLALQEFSEKKSILYNKQSDYQSILVFKSAQYGNALVLDGVLQLTERDEFCYHEMMAHLPLFSHANPKHILIIGGGDGGLLKQVCRHACVERITLVEIDSQVIKVAKKHFATSTAVAFDDPRLTIVHVDGFEYMQTTTETFDVIFADALDPIGPGETIFTPDFYELMYKALNNGGVVCVQSECIWINLNLISDVLHCCKEIFDDAQYATVNIPSFPCGQTGVVLCRKGKHGSFQKPLRLPSPKLACQLKWYNPGIHEASFQLPEFVNQHLGIQTDESDQCIVGGCILL